MLFSNRELPHDDVHELKLTSLCVGFEPQPVMSSMATLRQRPNSVWDKGFAGEACEASLTAAVSGCSSHACTGSARRSPHLR